MASYLDRDNYGMYRNADKHGPGPALMGADTLLGNDVVNGQEESLGDIKEFMIDMHSGQIAYAVLAFGGFLGMGEKLFAVPFNALQLDTENHRFILNVPKDRLQQAPGFDKDDWPDMADSNWADQVHAFYGTEPYGSPMGGGMRSGSMGAGAAMGAGAGSMGAGHAGRERDPGVGSELWEGREGSGSDGNTGAGSTLSEGSAGGRDYLHGGSTLSPRGDVDGGAASTRGRGLELGGDGRLEPGTGSIIDANYQERQD
ncbi:MAG: PRC-barrel domain-containing protein [Telluria sp.]